MIQQELDFVTRTQNSEANQIILEVNKVHLNKQCRLLLDLFNSGRVITVRSAMDYGIGDARARVRDLIHAGYNVKSQLIEGRFKKYWIEKTN